MPILIVLFLFFGWSLALGLFLWVVQSRILVKQLSYDRNRSNDRLRSSEAQLQLALAAANQGIWDWDLQTQAVTWDDRCKALFGVPLEVTSTYATCIKAIHPDDRQWVEAAVAQALRDRTEFDAVYRALHADGTIRWILVRGRGSYDAKGEPYRMTGTVLDITDRKQAELDCQASEERLNLALQSTGAAIWDWQPLTNQLWASEQFYAVSGLDAQSQIPTIETWIQQYIDPIDRDRVSTEWQAVVAQQHPTFATEYRILHPQGKRWIADQAQLYYQADGQLSRVVGTLLDITARKQSEAALIQTSNILQAVIESTNDVIFIKDLQGRYALANQAAANWLDRTPESMLGQDDYALFPADVVEQIQAVDRQVIAQGEPVTYEEQLHKQGKLRSLLTTKYPWRNDQGETIGMIGIAIDVTELKQAEIALRESEARYRFLVENTSDMVFRIGLHEPLPLDLSIDQAVDWIFREAYFAAVNDGCLRAYGFDQASDLVGQPLTRVVPRTPENEAMERTLVTNGHRIVEARTEEVDRQGNRKVRLNSIVGRIENGYVYDYIGTSRDITEQVLAEAALAAQEARYRYIFNSVGVSIWEEDFSEVKAAIDHLKASGVQDFAQYFADHPEFVQSALASIRIIDVNATTLRLYGTQDKAQLLNSLQNVFLPETIPAFIEELLTLAKGEPFLQAETVIRTLQGQPVPVLFSITFPAPTEPFDRVLVTLTDIRDRKQAEIALAQNQATMEQQLAEIEAIYQTAPIGLTILDRDLRFVRLNQQLAEINGLSIEAHLGRRVREIVPDLADTVEPLLQRILDTGEPLLDLEITGETAAQPGIQRTWLENWFPLRNPQGEIIGINAVIQEITDRKRSESVMRENEERLRLALTAANQGMYDLNIQTGETIVSPEYAQLLGYDPATFVETNANWLERLHPDDRESTTRIYQEYVAGDRQEYRVEFRQRTQSGDWKWILSLGKIIAWDANGNPLRLLGTHTDISDRKQAEADLQQQTEELRQLNRLKDEFLAALSHELRTPLNPILGWTQLLKRQQFSSGKTSQALNIIERNVQHQLALIDDLLDVSRLIQGRLNLTFQPIDLALILTTTIGTVSFAAQAKSISIAYQGLPSLRTMGDGDRLRQIFWNLLSNAIKFTPNGGYVEVILEQSKIQNSIPQSSTLSYAQIRISDTGIGIAPSFLPYVFDHFRQADGSTTRKYGGLGLGLAIVRHLVELHGGTVQVQSDGADQGSAFIVRLPIPANMALWDSNQLDSDRSPSATTLTDAMMDDTRKTVSAPVSATVSATVSAVDNPLFGLRILVVDDEPDNLALLQFLLQEEGAIVITADSALEAIDCLTAALPAPSNGPVPSPVLPQKMPVSPVSPVSQRSPAAPQPQLPQLIVSDIGMSEMDGYEFMRRVRALPHCRSIPALALSAFAQPEDQLAAIEVGYQAYLTKPVNPLQFLAALTQLL